MAVKTITIDMDAYTLLARRKATGQSFSQVIKEHFGRRPTVGDLRVRLRSVRIGDDTLDAMDAQVRDRRKHLAPAARR